MKNQTRAVIITGPGFQDHDVVYSYYRSKEEGIDVSIATKSGEPVTGKYGITVPMDKRSKANISFDELRPEDFDLVILTGGHEAPDRVRQDQRVKDFVLQMAEQGRIVAGLCHGPWIMISAGVLKDKLACAYVGLKDDMVNCGAKVIDADVVVDGNIITCSYYAECGKFMREAFDAVARLRNGETLPEPRVV
ncbi:DJ-1/PfpI family protein [Klebsiella quasipneumoniae]|uniref:DJ-1/PfpI family protein n=1 Tax=Klebsiella quasipneumoniae TaxID=1463165 RepID=UPI001BA57421|nr:DJ-1/PfpI family protein [Klebsiella quasipneumoniae]MBS3685125.1 DJ-1/PfpI family protein [Klebsiella quasipneumoniae]